jgi:excisionase family DNA binding protein
MTAPYFIGEPISPHEAAKRLGVTPAAIYARMDRGTIRKIKVGGRFRVDSADLAVKDRDWRAK